MIDPPPIKPNYAPPIVPKDYRPFHTFVDTAPPGGSSAPRDGKVTITSGEVKKLDAYGRGSLLGEAPHLSQ